MKNLITVFFKTIYGIIVAVFNRKTSKVISPTISEEDLKSMFTNIWPDLDIEQIFFSSNFKYQIPLKSDIKEFLATKPRENLPPRPQEYDCENYSQLFNGTIHFWSAKNRVLKYPWAAGEFSSTTHAFDFALILPDDDIKKKPVLYWYDLVYGASCHDIPINSEYHVEGSSFNPHKLHAESIIRIEC